MSKFLVDQGVSAPALVRVKATLAELPLAPPMQVLVNGESPQVAL